ncbi:MAG: hypothetical protein NZ870_04875 [bacterium]|nr:hypothetical protein [bacterium]
MKKFGGLKTNKVLILLVFVVSVFSLLYLFYVLYFGGGKISLEGLVSAVAQSDGEKIRRVPKQTGSLKVNLEHPIAICRVVVNNHHQDIMIPARTKEEFCSFLKNKPPYVELLYCEECYSCYMRAPNGDCVPCRCCNCYSTCCKSIHMGSCD